MQKPCLPKVKREKESLKTIRNAQIAKKRDIAAKIASQKAEERLIKPQTGGKKARKGKGKEGVKRKCKCCK